MSVKKIKEHNGEQFLEDLKSVRDIMVDLEQTNSYFRIKKKDLLEAAQKTEINYYMTDKIFVVKRFVMVVF